MEKHKLAEYIKKLKQKGLLEKHNVEESILNIIVECVTYDSREVEKGTCFICKGAHFKKEYLESAIEDGCFVYVSDKVYEDIEIPYIKVNDIRKTIAVLSELYNNYPQKKINMIGITGTKGKSTTTCYIKSILDEYMEQIDSTDTAMISSINTYDGKTNKEAVITTPEALEVYRHIRNAVDSNLKNLVMEVSSQALKTNRVYDIMYKFGVFLNISEDHVSDIEHKDFNDYLESKLKIFSQTETACINIDSDEIEKILEAAKNSKKIVTFGRNKNADVFAYEINKKGKNTTFKVKTQKWEKEFVLTMPGLFNVENALAAITVATELGVPYEYIYKGLKKAKVSGRMEVYTNKDEEIVVIVDYAHNKLSFEKLYESTKKEYPQRKIVTVFGCPGEHALNRRKDLGELSGKYSDMNYLTMEDPRGEETVNICKEISVYIEKENGKYKIIEDRGQAIKQAIFDTDRNSVILITGKGNETRQKVGNKYIKCLTDVQYAKKYLKEYDKLKKLS